MITKQPAQNLPIHISKIYQDFYYFLTELIHMEMHMIVYGPIEAKSFKTNS